MRDTGTRELEQRCLCVSLHVCGVLIIIANVYLLACICVYIRECVCVEVNAQSVHV